MKNQLFKIAPFYLKKNVCMEPDMAVCQHKESQLLEKLRQKEHLSQGVGNQLEQQRKLMSFF